MTNKKVFNIFGLLFIPAIVLLAIQGCENKSQEQQTFTSSQKLTPEEMQALELGRKVLAVKAAIQNPDDPNSLEAIRDLGLDSRYYVMVRGWLSMELEGARSIMEASGENPNPEIKKRADFLNKAIRAIDLE